MKTKEDYKCPKCGKKNRIKIFDYLSSDNIPSIITREIFTKECPECHEKTTVEYKVTVVDEKFIVMFTPSSDEEVTLDETRDVMRVCDTFDDFKEKLMILYDGYNDIIIEFIKEFLLNQMDDVMKHDTTEIRYDGDNEENLIFYLRGADKSIGCGKYFYDELLKKSKLKKINKCINIDSNTYHNYFRLR